MSTDKIKIAITLAVTTHTWADDRHTVETPANGKYDGMRC